MAKRAIAVIGLSTFGTALVRQLAECGCRLLAADRNPERVDAVRDLVDEAIIADVSDRRALEPLRLHDFDMVVLSLGEPLDASLLAVLHLRDLGVSRIVARAVTEDHRRLLLQLGVTRVVFPEIDMAERTARILSSDGMIDSLPIDDDVSVVEVTPTPVMHGQTLAALDLPRRFRLRVLALRNTATDTVQVSPDPTSTITARTALIVFGRHEDIDRMLGK